jgi:hypothetical protein
MSTAVITSALADNVRTSSKLSQIAMRCINALIESRTRSVERELRRHEAFMNDLGRRQSHSSQFLSQTDLLPFKL